MKHRLLALAPLMVAAAPLAGARADVPSPSAPPPASQKAVAEALFEEARALVQAGRPGEACPKLAESQRLDPAPGTLLNLADCYEKEGKTASAWATFKDAQAEARRAGRADWETVAAGRAEALRPRLARMVVRVAASADAPGLEIRRDGAVVGRAEWGASVPVDPGSHAIEATAPGKVRWTTSAAVTSGGEEVEVSVPALADAPPGAPAVAPGPADVAPGGFGAAQRPLALVAGATGAVALGFGVMFAVQAKSKSDDARAFCNGTVCAEDGVLLNQDAKTAAGLATAAFVAGGVLLAGGAALWLTAPSAPRAVSLRVVPTGLGAAAAGTF